MYSVAGIIPENHRDRRNEAMLVPIWDIPYTEMWPDDIHWLPLLLQGKKFKTRFLFGAEIRFCRMVMVEEKDDVIRKPYNAMRIFFVLILVLLLFSGTFLGGGASSWNCRPGKGTLVHPVRSSGEDWRSFIARKSYRSSSDTMTDVVPRCRGSDKGAFSSSVKHFFVISRFDPPVDWFSRIIREDGIHPCFRNAASDIYAYGHIHDNGEKKRRGNLHSTFTTFRRPEPSPGPSGT